MTTILSYFVVLLLFGEKLPETSDNIPLFTIYLSSVILLSAISLLCSTCVLYIHNYQSENKMPKWMEIMLKCFSCKDVRNDKGDFQNETSVSSYKREWTLAVKLLDRILLVIFTFVFCILTSVFAFACLSD